MVCIASFIILCVAGVFVFIISIWKREVGKSYLKLLKKAWQCAGKRLTLQKCDTSFKEDVKNTLLKKVILIKPSLVKPVSVAVEVLAVAIVLLTAFSFVEALKSGLALYSLGTCNVSRPDSCILGSYDSCLMDQQELNWFEEWGVIFANIPDRMKKWDAGDYLNENSIYYMGFDPSLDSALDIFDPLCNKCIESYKKQLEDGFLEKYNVAVIPYSIKGDTKAYRFNNSYMLSTYLLAAHEVPSGGGISPTWKLIGKLADEERYPGMTWQSAFLLDETSEDEVHRVMDAWLRSIGYNDAEIERVVALTTSEEIKSKMSENERLVEEVIRARGVPTTIYDGKKHTGVFKSSVKNDTCDSECDCLPLVHHFITLRYILYRY
jgi:hypothetical protein